MRHNVFSPQLLISRTMDITVIVFLTYESIELFFIWPLVSKDDLALGDPMKGLLS